MPATASSRDRLTDIRTKLSDARDRRAGAQKAVDAALAANDTDAQHAANVALAQASGDVERMMELDAVVVSQLAGISRTSYTTETALDNPAVVSELQRIAVSSGRLGRMNVGEVLSAETLVGMIESGDWGGRTMATATATVAPDPARYGEFAGINQVPRRALRLLDLVPTQTMEGGSFFYAQESGGLDDAAETSEVALKPQGDDELASAQVIASSIAVWQKVAKQQLADVPSFGTWLQQRLSYKVLRRCEQAILNGSGTAPALKGILQTSGIASVAYSGTPPLGELVLTGVIDALGSEAVPNAVILNPTDYGTLLIGKASGSGDYYGGGPFAPTPGQMWGLPVITSTAIPAHTALVGDFTLGCTLFIREGLQVLVTDNDQDDFVRNRATILAEMRAGFAVWQPTAFAKVALA
jgi:HK97 family phage major capsid protein